MSHIALYAVQRQMYTISTMSFPEPRPSCSPSVITPPRLRAILPATRPCAQAVRSGAPNFSLFRSKPRRRRVRAQDRDERLEHVPQLIRPRGAPIHVGPDRSHPPPEPPMTTRAPCCCSNDSSAPTMRRAARRHAGGTRGTPARRAARAATRAVGRTGGRREVTVRDHLGEAGRLDPSGRCAAQPTRAAREQPAGVSACAPGQKSILITNRSHLADDL